MWWFLRQCFAKKNLDAEIETKCDEDAMVDAGYLIKVREKTYKLSKKSKGILYAVYGK